MSERIPIEEIAPSQISAWRTHPVTLAIFQYCNDYADATETAMLGAWREGKVKLVDEEARRGLVTALRDIPGIKYDTLAQFYGLKPENPEGSDAGQNSQQPKD